MERIKVEYIKIGDIIPYINNPRKNDHAVDKVASSIKNFGFKNPIIVDKDNEIIAGHTRLKAAKKLGMKEVPVIRAEDLNEAQVKAFRIADNKTTELADWDFELLENELEELKLEDFDLGLTGFDFDELDELFQDEEYIETEEDDFEIEEPENPISKRGDIWLLGRHRLMCGSSTGQKDVDILMNNQKAKILFTSPPYLDLRDYEGEKNLSVEHIATFIKKYRKYTDYQCVNLGLVRENHELIQYWDEYIEVAKNEGYKLLAWNVWNKQMAGSIGMQSAMFPIVHEWIFVFGTEHLNINLTWEKKENNINKEKYRTVRQKDGSMKKSSRGDTSKPYKKMESVLSLYPETGSIRSKHPATFPVSLPSEYIQAMTKKDDIVIDAFGGSGSTLIAAEQLNRICYMMEIEGKYVDVIVDRYINYKGGSTDVYLVRDGEKTPYNEVVNM